MQLQVRSFQKNDLEAVEKIAQCVEYNSWTYAVFLDCLKDAYLNWVLYSVESGDIVGFLVTLIQGDECQLMNIAIEKKYWRLGYADRLVKSLIKVLKKKAVVKRIFLEVRCSNMSAIALYKKNGFSQISIRKGYYSIGKEKEDALVFCLEVGEERSHKAVA